MPSSGRKTPLELDLRFEKKKKTKKLLTDRWKVLWSN